MTVELSDHRPVGDEHAGTEQNAGESHPGNEKDQDTASVGPVRGKI